jgi:hypothetical protein
MAAITISRDASGVGPAETLNQATFHVSQKAARQGIPFDTFMVDRSGKRGRDWYFEPK